MKYREPASIEDALIECAALIGWTAMAEAVGRKERMVRNWADPDHKSQIPVPDLLAIDRVCLAQTGQAPLLACLKRIEDRYGKREVEACVFEATLNLHAAVGQFSHTLKGALSPQSPGGQRLSLCERHELAPILRQVMRAVEDAQHGLKAKNVVPITGKVS